MFENRSVACLIFITFEGKIEDIAFSNRSKVKGYALLPQIKSSSKILRAFSRNGVRVLKTVLDCVKLQQALISTSLSVEVVEVLFEEGSEVRNFLGQKVGLKFCTVKGNKRVVNLLLGNNAVYRLGSLNFRTDFNQTINSENLMLIKSLLKQKADIKYRHPCGGTLLHLAVKRGHELLVKTLLNEGACVTAKRNDSSTPLHLAAERGNLAIVKLLLQNGASVNAKKSDGSTALHISALLGYRQIVKLLLQHGARVQARRYDGSTAVHSAAAKGNALIVEVLLQEGASTCSFNSSKVSKNLSPMHLAIENKHIRVVNVLLKHGVNVNTEYNDQTILQLAVKQGNLNVVEAILNHHPNLNNTGNQKALCEAVALQNGKKIIETLLQYGFKINPESTNKPQLLFESIRKNYVHVVSQLLDHTFDINKLWFKSENKERYGPLHLAAACSGEDLIRLLLAHGADPLILTSKSRTVVDMAIVHSNESAAKLFIKAEGATYDKNELLSTAVKHDFAEIVKYLVSTGADLNSNSHGVPLTTAVDHDNFKTVKLLLELGADINATCPDGETPLFKACEKFVVRSQMIEFLIENGANVNARSCNGSTPLITAADWGNDECFEILLNYGADLHAVTDDGLSALWKAAMFHSKSLKLLLDYAFTDVTLLTKSQFGVFHFEMIFEPGCNEEIRNFIMEERDDFEEASIVLAKHMIQMDSAGFRHGLNDLMWYCEDISKSDFESMCVAEVASLKNTKVASNISYFDVLISDVYHLTCFARNPEIVDALKSKGLEEKFPIFASILSCQLRKGIHRRELLDQGINACRFLISSFPQVPRFLKEKIFNYLSNQEIKMVIAASTLQSMRQN